MKIKHKIGFIALITMIDIFVIILVVINSDKTSIQNDVNTKTSAHFLAKTEVQTQVKNEIAEVINEVKEDNNEEVQESNEQIQEENNEEIQEEKQIEDNKTEKVEENKTTIENKIEENIDEVVQTVEPVIENNNVSNEIGEQVEENREIIQLAFDDLTLEEKIESLNAGTLILEYSGLYTNSNERLTKSKGVVYYNGHRETYYSEKVLPGPGLKIPGRHVAEDGTIRDEDGYICVASDLSYLSRGSILITSLGPAKVYDTGCAYGTIDIYVNW